MNIDRSYAPVHRQHRDRLARDVRAGRHAGGEHPVEAEHELVGLVVVGEEARRAEPVDLREPGAGRVAVDGARVRARHAEQPRAVPEQVAEDPARPRRVRREPARRERVRHDEVPVRAVARRGEPVERPLLRRQLVGHEQRPVAEALRRARDRGPQRAVDADARACARGRPAPGSRSSSRRGRSRAAPRPPRSGPETLSTSWPSRSVESGSGTSRPPRAAADCRARCASTSPSSAGVSARRNARSRVRR